MKKRFISMLLAVLLVVSLFAGTSVSAYADGEYKTVSYTLVKGDTLLQICNNMGLNFYTCQTAINKLNNFTSEAQYRKLYVGQVIKLPATNEDAAKIASSYISGSTGSGTVVNTGSSSGSTGSVSGNVAYWLIPYTIQRGETVVGVCNTLGISFNTYSSQIMKINNISSWNRVAAGKTLLLPTAVKPAAGISCYAVIAHKVAQGETTYGICQNYGISYTSNASLMQALNPSVNFNFIKYNTTMLVPVPTVITAGTTGGTTSGGTTSGGTTSGNTNSGSTNSGTGSSTKTYSISSSASGGGSVSFTVSGKSATAAAAGSTVTIKATPQAYKSLESVSVVTADNSAVIAVSNNTFTMPESNVKVTAKFSSSGYYMGIVNAGGGTASTYVDGVATDRAVKGATVKVYANPSSGYSLTDITVKKADSAKTVVASGLKSGDSFTMPDCKVMIYVTFTGAQTYSLKSEATTNGSFSLQVLGTTVTKAAAGSTVKVVTSPNAGYAVDKIEVIDDSSKQQINYNNSDSFTMPYSSVTVKVTFVRSVDTYKVTVSTVKGGNASVDHTTAKGGETIKLSPTAYSGYVFDYFTITYNGGIVEEKRGTLEFLMPYSDVTVTPVFKQAQGQLSMDNTSPSWGTLTVTDASGKTLSEGDALTAGSKVTVTVNVTDPGYVASIRTTRGEAITSGSQVTVPSDGNLGIVVTYDYKNYTLTVNNEWYNLFYLEIGGQRVDITSKGQQVSVPAYATVQAKPVNSTITGMTLNNELKSGDSITMPAANATLKVELTENSPAINSLSTAQEVPGVFGLAPELEN